MHGVVMSYKKLFGYMHGVVMSYKKLFEDMHRVVMSYKKNAWRYAWGGDVL